MSDGPAYHEDWRDAIAIDENHDDGPTPVIRRTGESVSELIGRIMESGSWDGNSEPDMVPALDLLRELLDDGAVLNWLDREIAIENEDDDALAVRECFESYQEAMMAGDHEVMLSLLDEGTRARLLRYRDMAQAGERITPDSATPTIDSICTGFFAEVFPADLLRESSDEEIILFTADHLFSGPEGFAQFHIGRIETGEGEAWAELFAGDLPQPLPIRIEFMHEEGGWRINIVSLFPIVETTYNGIAIEQGLSPEEFVKAYIAAARDASQN